MRKALLGFAIVLFANQLAADTVLRRPGREGDPVAGAPWVTRASLISAEAAFTAEVPSGNRPIALIETNYYTFLAGEPLQLRITTNANGYSAPATLYLYWENRTTGERRYYNIGAQGLLAAGTAADLFGSVGAPVPIVVPNLNDFVLFGSASDSAGLSWGINGALGASRTVPAGQTGLFQWVLEFRDAAGKRVLSRSHAMYSHVESTVQVSGTITASTTWTANNRYVLNDFVGVASPAVLTIEPGTVIYGGGGRATLFIQRGAKIMADGTARRPIIFTSPQKVGDRSQRDWGSLVVLGQAPINVPGGQAFMEGLPSEPAYAYGGTDPEDSSGVLRYVRLEFGGFEIQTGQEINGLTLAGLGRGTVVEYIQVLHNKDDAFEFFGGTVNARYLLAVAMADDGLDFDFGYLGSVQFAVLIKRAINDESDSNFYTESDNNGQGTGDTPLTNPRVYNVTAIRVASGTGNYGGVLRRNTAGKHQNVIISGSRLAPITIRDSSTFSNTTSGELVIDHSILHGDFSDASFPNSADRASQTRDFLFTTMTRNRNADPLLAMGTPSLIKTYMPDLTPLSGSPALDADFVGIPPDNGFLRPVDFIGGVGPGDNWVLSGWANFSDN